MSLPVVAFPEYSVKLLSIKQPVKFRPYLAKEEKLLLMAQQSNDPKEVERVVQQIVEACTFGNINVKTLPTFDLEMLFLQLRARSVNNIIEVRFQCRAKTNADAADDDDAARCGTFVPVTINIDEITYTVPEGHTDTFWLTDDLGVTLRYPTSEMFEGLHSDTPPSVLDMLPKCLGTVFTKSGDTFEAQEQTPQEIQTFIDSLTVGQVDKLATFFATMPRVSHTFLFQCPKCQYSEEIVLEGLMDFFD